MKLGITSKLFLAISAACILVAVAMGVAVRLSFQRGFIDYLGAQAAAGTEQLSRGLETEYAKHGNWDFLRNNQSAWNALVARTVLGTRSGNGSNGGFQRRFGPPGANNGNDQGPPSGDFQGPPGGPPGPPPGAPLDGPPGPPPDFAGGGNGGNNANGGPGNGPPDRFGPGFGPGPERTPPTALYDTQMQRVAGNGPPPMPDARREAVTVNGQTVGWLVVASPSNLLYAADRQFQSQQVRATWIIVGFAALLAAAFAMVLARLILAPIRRVVLATHRLASGDYSARVPEAGGDELHQLAVDFNQLANSLDKAARARRDFIADISHELRTPLAVLRGELEAIEDGVRSPDKTTIASLQSEVAMLSQLIDDLYELSLADIGALSFEKVPVDVAPLVESAAEAFRERLASRNLALETHFGDEPALMSGDPHRLTQLLKNLLENAVRYTDPGGKVRVAVTADADLVQIDVQDSFPAVPEPMLPHLFDRLFRVDASRSRQSGGAGLGLALCQHIVREHGGTITAMRSPFGGLWINMRFHSLKSPT
ncbi:ATP-binding protein [Paraburkholderia phosphatilytica]|uniref:ATP-binding protein n=1 Tax=Paraburkholderia phosphatilytica TaxID=2282883 RepID=UPI000E4E2E48|nr:ATP-binding protein [Paraburkholderia phosphatilytica]